MKKKISNEGANKGKFYMSFALWFLFGMVLGILFVVEGELGILSMFNLKMIKDFIIFVAPYLLLLNTVIFIIILECNIRKNRNLLDKKDDSLYDIIDKSLSKGLVASSALVFINFLLFSLGFYNLKDSPMNFIFLLIIIVVFMISLFVAIMYQGKIVSMIKLMNPEKKGDIYDKKFSEKWLDSCDELEKTIIYKASYKVYELMSKVISFLFVAFTILGMFYDVGIIVIIVLGFLQCVLVFGYMYYANKLEYGEK